MSKVQHLTRSFTFSSKQSAYTNTLTSSASTVKPLVPKKLSSAPSPTANMETTETENPSHSLPQVPSGLSKNLARRSSFKEHIHGDPLEGNTQLSPLKLLLKNPSFSPRRPDTIKETDEDQETIESTQNCRLNREFSFTSKRPGIPDTEEVAILQKPASKYKTELSLGKKEPLARKLSRSFSRRGRTSNSTQGTEGAEERSGIVGLARRLSIRSRPSEPDIKPPVDGVKGDWRCCQQDDDFFAPCDKRNSLLQSICERCGHWICESCNLIETSEQKKKRLEEDRILKEGVEKAMNARVRNHKGVYNQNVSVREPASFQQRELNRKNRREMRERRRQRTV